MKSCNYVILQVHSCRIADQGVLTLNGSLGEVRCGDKNFLQFWQEPSLMTLPGTFKHILIIASQLKNINFDGGEYFELSSLTNFFFFF